MLGALIQYKHKHKVYIRVSRIQWFDVHDQLFSDYGHYLIRNTDVPAL